MLCEFPCIKTRFSVCQYMCKSHPLFIDSIYSSTFMRTPPYHLSATLPVSQVERFMLTFLQFVLSLIFSTDCVSCSLLMNVTVEISPHRIGRYVCMLLLLVSFNIFPFQGVSVSFKFNTARLSGAAIYASDLRRCSWLGNNFTDGTSLIFNPPDNIPHSPFNFM